MCNSSFLNMYLSFLINALYIDYHHKQFLKLKNICVTVANVCVLFDSHSCYQGVFHVR